MSFAIILVLAVALVLLSIVVGLVFFVRFLTSESDDDRAMRFDPFARRQASPWFIDFFNRWRSGPGRLTYRRDSRGRFRKRER